MPMPTERDSGLSWRARDHVCRGYRRRGEFVSHAHESWPPANGCSTSPRVTRPR
ncbi:hypothetical protein [Amycolatopsis sp. MtRt-6]|uniref:hypothetical protein n=1 Tax=Amycolatopsis sp. MtRt-6 TaxID=2792782 RepID=UPI001A8C047C|nr:hypothetical protein [Amycolatopsis sp. MtRt-6]